MGLCLRRGLASALLLALLPACAGCRDPRQAETLDRPTALTLLREQGEAALRGPTWSIDLVVYDTDPAEAARLAFLKNLAPTLVKLTITEEVEAPGFSLSPTKRPRAKRYEFEPAEPKTAPHLLRGEMMKIARFAIADPGYQKVTGIVQEGSGSRCDRRGPYAPNAAYRTISRAISTAGPKPGFALEALPAEAELAKTVTREVAFRRYDDGWRVEGPKLFS
jgi:hypothetical protein